MKVTRTVLRREGGSNSSDLADTSSNIHFSSNCNFRMCNRNSNLEV